MPPRLPGRAIAVGWGGIHPDERLLSEEPDALVHTAEELHAALDAARRVAELRRLVEHHNYRYHVLDDPEVPDSAYDALYDELKELEDRRTRSSSRPTRPRSAWARPPRPASEGRASAADGIAREGDDRRAPREVGHDVRKRLGTDEPVAYVIEPKIDGSAISLVHERGSSSAARPAATARAART